MKIPVYNIDFYCFLLIIIGLSITTACNRSQKVTSYEEEPRITLIIEKDTVCVDSLATTEIDGLAEGSPKSTKSDVKTPRKRTAKTLGKGNPKSKQEQQLVSAANNLLSALKVNDLSKAGKYGSSYGLGMFLYLDVESIEQYQIVGQKVMGKMGFVYTKLNGWSKTLPMMFKKQGKKWTLTGLDIQSFLNIDEKQLYRRQRFTHDQIAP